MRKPLEHVWQMVDMLEMRPNVHVWAKSRHKTKDHLVRKLLRSGLVLKNPATGDYYR